MCLMGGKQPKPPIKTPAEQPADSWMTVEGSTQRDGEPEVATPKPVAAPAPKVATGSKAGIKKVRM